MKPRYFITERLTAESRARRIELQWSPRTRRRLKRSPKPPITDFRFPSIFISNPDGDSRYGWLLDAMQPAPPADNFVLQEGGTEWNHVWLDPAIGMIRRRRVTRAEWEREYQTDPGPALPLAPRES